MSGSTSNRTLFREADDDSSETSDTVHLGFLPVLYKVLVQD